MFQRLHSQLTALEGDEDKTSVISEEDEDLSTLPHNQDAEDAIPPLFLHLTCTIRIGGHVYSTISLKNLPTCLGKSPFSLSCNSLDNLLFCLSSLVCIYFAPWHTLCLIYSARDRLMLEKIHSYWLMELAWRGLFAKLDWTGNILIFINLCHNRWGSTYFNLPRVGLGCSQDYSGCPLHDSATCTGLSQAGGGDQGLSSRPQPLPTYHKHLFHHLPSAEAWQIYLRVNLRFTLWHWWIVSLISAGVRDRRPPRK